MPTIYQIRIVRPGAEETLLFSDPQEAIAHLEMLDLGPGEMATLACTEPEHRVIRMRMGPTP